MSGYQVLFIDAPVFAGSYDMNSAVIKLLSERVQCDILGCDMYTYRIHQFIFHYEIIMCSTDVCGN